MLSYAACCVMVLRVLVAEAWAQRVVVNFSVILCFQLIRSDLQTAFRSLYFVQHFRTVPKKRIVFAFPAYKTWLLMRTIRSYLFSLSFFIFFMLPSGAHGQTVQFDIPGPRSYYMPESPGLYWLYTPAQIGKARDWLALIEHADTFGLRPSAYHATALADSLSRLARMDSSARKQLDWSITGAVLLFMKHLHQGNIRLHYDEVLQNHDSLYSRMLLASETVESVSTIAAVMDCKDHDYLVMKRYFNDSVTRSDTVRYKSLVTAMNYRRYLSFVNPREYVLVNIPAAEAWYYRNDSLILPMRTGVGKPEHQTPRFASHILNVETFPYWNVPRSIAVKEILHEVQKDHDYLVENNFDVLDAKGNIVDDTALHWDEWNERNFPYRFRQSTGSDNALGVLKFNLRNPYSVYLHATAWPGVFSRDYRFVSHGCVRLEKPLQLAHHLLRGQINMKELSSPRKGRKPKVYKLKQKVPVFVIYSPVEVDGERVKFLRDEYRLLQ
jgi:murein L,D-transpeptidase YcbB/YkuD